MSAISNSTEIPAIPVEFQAPKREVKHYLARTSRMKIDGDSHAIRYREKSNLGAKVYKKVSITANGITRTFDKFTPITVTTDNKTTKTVYIDIKDLVKQTGTKMAVDVLTTQMVINGLSHLTPESTLMRALTGFDI